MRIALVVTLLVLAAAPASMAQGDASHATLDVEVGADHAETMVLTFSGLRTLTQYQNICLPDRALESRVHDDLGDLAYESRSEGTRRVITFSARGSDVIVDMARPAGDAIEGPLLTRDVNFCVPHETGVTVNVRVPADHTLYFLSGHGSTTDERTGSTSSEGPTHVFYSYEAPLAGTGLDVFEEGPFRVFVDPALAPRAREVARLAVGPYQAALSEAGLPAPFDKIRVLYAAQTPFDWEAGHYDGHGSISVKTSTLDDAPSAGFPYTPVKVLVHESFHAASFPYGQGDVTDKISWFLEGSARHAERQVDLTMPNGTIHCEQSAAERRCWSFDDRLSEAQLASGYASDFTFERRWEPSLPQDEDTRRFYYGFSEFVLGAWIEQRGEGAYRALWDKVLPALNEGEGCPCDDGWLLGLFDDDALFRPWDDVRTSDPAGFDARVAPFVRDEARLQRALDDGAGPLSGLGVPSPAWAGLVGLALVGLALRRRR